MYGLRAYQLVMLGPVEKEDNKILPDLTLPEIFAVIGLFIFIFGIGFFPGATFEKSNATLQSFSKGIKE